MIKAKHVFWELTLILASVLIFRSLWTLMDSVINFSSIGSLVASLVIGAALAGFAIRKLAHAD